ncbi:MAG: hypothetical protein C0490_18830 [Marivirga sp.]|nr:hypothetical protein [Marivirga sp.]
MIYFRQTIINQIKSASNEKEVEKAINESLQRLRIKDVNGHIIQRFILGMGKALHHETTEKPSAKTLENINIAIDLFKKLHKPLENSYE